MGSRTTKVWCTNPHSHLVAADFPWNPNLAQGAHHIPRHKWADTERLCLLASPSRTCLAWQKKLCSRPSPGHWTFQLARAIGYRHVLLGTAGINILVGAAGECVHFPAVRVGIIEFEAWELTAECQICHRTRTRMHVASWVVAPSSLLRCRRFLTSCRVKAGRRSGLR